LSASPAAAAIRVSSPAVISRPIAISSNATATPAISGCEVAKKRSRNLPGVPCANPFSWVPM
jgi:hypothetical protein